MERETIKERAERLTASDNPEQMKWENKELGNDAKFVKKSRKKRTKSPTSVRWPEDLFNELVAVAEYDGIQRQQLINSILTQALRKRKNEDPKLLEYIQMSAR